MNSKDILDILKDHLYETIKDSKESKEELIVGYSDSSRNYLNGYHDGVIYICDELLDLIDLLTK